jgi:alkaline phosphatase
LPNPVTDADPGQADRRPIVILMIGDGMGPGQLDVASQFRHGESGQLFMQKSLSYQGHLRTGNLSGIVDSAAAATTMSTGKLTYNTAIALDRHGVAVKTLLEEARDLGIATGVVSTAYLSHATPAAFTAHHWTRHEPESIASDQAKASGADLLMGGGAKHFSAALMGEMQSNGYRLVEEASELATLEEDPTGKVIGLFASEHMDYVPDRAEESTQPSLSQMSLASLDFLAAKDRGFFLMIEGARIDMASHGSDLERTIAETLAFDDAVRAVHEWAQDREEVTILVTADHECGGLKMLDYPPPGVLPDVSWRWGLHTNTEVSIFAEGESGALFDEQTRDHRWVYASLLAALTGEPLVPPARALVANGDLEDLRYEVASQGVESGFGPGLNQLDALRVDADEFGFSIGVEGVFEWDQNAIVVLIDTDFGTETGSRAMNGEFTDHTGVIDDVLSNMRVASVPAGFGAEFALVSRGGQDPHLEDRWEEAGVRALVPPYGQANDFGWFGAAINFADNTRGRGEQREVLKGQGFESFIPWKTLFPSRVMGVPEGSRLAISVLLVNSDGTYLSNQALPSFAPGQANPGETPVALPGVVVIDLDGNNDGLVDSELAMETSVAGAL